VREATRICRWRACLKRSAHRGVAVAQLSLEDVAEIYRLRHLLEIPAVRAAKMDDTMFGGNAPGAGRLRGSRGGVDWVRAVRFDLHFHTLLDPLSPQPAPGVVLRKLLSELRMEWFSSISGTTILEAWFPFTAGSTNFLTMRAEECATLLAQHLRDSETRLTAVMDQRIARAAAK